MIRSGSRGYFPKKVAHNHLETEAAMNYLYDRHAMERNEHMNWKQIDGSHMIYMWIA